MGLGNPPQLVPFKPEDGSRGSSRCAEAEPLPDTRTAFTCRPVAAGSCLSPMPGTACGRQGPRGGGEDTDSQRTPGVRRGGQEGSRSPPHQESQQSSSPPALRPRGVHPAIPTGGIRAAQLPAKPHSPSANFPVSSPTSTSHSTLWGSLWNFQAMRS